MDDLTLWALISATRSEFGWGRLGLEGRVGGGLIWRRRRGDEATPRGHRSKEFSSTVLETVIIEPNVHRRYLKKFWLTSVYQSGS